MGELVTIYSNAGVPFTVDSDHAESFRALLNDIEGAGVSIDPRQSGGYSNRNILGTNRPSMHASGQAIDVNWESNPVGQVEPIPGGNRSQPGPLKADPGYLPRDVAAQIAERHGFTWGGNWRSPYDPMHFEVNRGTPRIAAAPPPAGQPPPRGNTPVPDLMDDLIPPEAAPPPAQQPRAQAPLPPQAQTVQHDNWGSWLRDPVNRAMLISTGVSLMAGGWGNPMAQLGQAMGHGAEAAAGTAKAQSDEDFRRAELEARASEGELNRRSARDIAQANIAGRESVANIRGEYSLQRALAQSGARIGTAEDQIFRQAWTQTMTRLTNNNLTRIGGPLTEEQMLAAANTAAMEALRGHRSARGGGQAPPRPGAGETAVPTLGPGDVLGGGAAQPVPPAGGGGGLRGLLQGLFPPLDMTAGDAPIPGLTTNELVGPPAGGAPRAAPQAAGGMSWQQMLEDPRMVAALQDPQFRAQLRARTGVRPDVLAGLNALEAQLSAGGVGPF